MPDTSTISGVPPASTQEAYERIRAWFSQPSAELCGERLDDDEIVCYYRGPGGQTCAAGSVIPNRLYDEQIESKSFHAVASGRVTTGTGAPDIDTSAIRDFFTNVDAKFVDQAQAAHDGLVEANGSAAEFLIELDTLATEFYLTVPA